MTTLQRAARRVIPAPTKAFTTALSRALSLSLGALTIAGCGDRKATTDEPYADIVASVIPRLEKQIGLPFKTPPKIARRSKEDVRQFVMKQLTSERGRTQIAGQQSAYRMLGLLPDTLDLGALFQRLLEEQVVGYYDPATKVLYVVDGAPKALLDQTVSHELVHALQDQYIAVDSIQGGVDDADRLAAAQAVLEGQAVYEGLRLDPNVGPMLKMPGGWDQIRDVIRDGQAGMPIFASAPRAVREGLLFPYLGGADFVRRFVERRPARELLSDLPVSTKQILNDAAFLTAPAGKRDVPTGVTLPAPSAGSVSFTNGFGEFETRLILNQHLRDEALARRGAGGIDGDRYAVLKLPAGEALVWASVWDSSVEGADFLDLLMDAARRRYELARPAVEAGATSRTLDVPAKGTRVARTVRASLLQIDGRPVVVFSDVPATVSAPLIDPTRITLSK